MDTREVAPDAASDALLASLVLRTLGEMRRRAQGEDAPAPTAMDLHRLEVLRDLVLSSWRGALEMHVAIEGEEPGDDDLVPDEYHMPDRSPADDVEVYDFVQRLRNNGRSLEDLIAWARRVTQTLKDLATTGWSANVEAIVDDDIEPFLRELRDRGVNAAHPPPGDWFISRF